MDYERINRALEEQRCNRKPQSLYEPIDYMLGLGGKRIRPMLMLMSYGLYKDDPERIMMQALALETYHNFTLLHDDLMDNSDKRRGQATVRFSRATRCWCWPSRGCSSVTTGT